MIGELLCPDCGGVVGATETTEAGPPCRCFVKDPADQAKPDETVSDAAPPEVTPAKVCRVCGKDVTGQKRVRDHLGYFCYECAKEQELKEHQGRVRCQVCGKLVKPESLTPYEGTKMCPACHHERIEAKKMQIKRMGFKGARTREEVRQLKNLLIIAGVLAVIMLYGAWHMLRH
jgi:DNA-directed RNA polymerase subunit RPC12/RpoP